MTPPFPKRKHGETSSYIALERSNMVLTEWVQLCRHHATGLPRVTVLSLRLEGRGSLSGVRWTTAASSSTAALPPTLLDMNDNYCNHPNNSNTTGELLPVPAVTRSSNSNAATWALDAKLQEAQR